MYKKSFRKTFKKKTGVHPYSMTYSRPIHHILGGTYGRYRYKGVPYPAPLGVGHKIISMKLRCATAFTTDVSGKFLSVYYISPNNFILGSSGTFGNWATLITMFREYHINGFKIDFLPEFPNASAEVDDDDGTTILTAYPLNPIYVLYDAEDATALPDAQTALDKSYVKYWMVNKQKKLYVKARTRMHTSAKYWQQTDTVDNQGFIKWFSENMKASTTYGRIVVTMYIKFRGQF